MRGQGQKSRPNRKGVNCHVMSANAGDHECQIKLPFINLPPGQPASFAFKCRPVSSADAVSSFSKCAHQIASDVFKGGQIRVFLVPNLKVFSTFSFSLKGRAASFFSRLSRISLILGHAASAVRTSGAGQGCLRGWRVSFKGLLWPVWGVLMTVFFNGQQHSCDTPRGSSS